MQSKLKDRILTQQVKVYIVALLLQMYAGKMEI